MPIETGPEESLVQPEWSPDGQLYVMSDRSDFWSLYRVEGLGLVPVALLAAELAGPLWQLGARWYDFLDEDTVLAIATGLGRSQLVALDLATGARHAARTCRSSSMPGSAVPAAAPWSRRCRTTARPSSA